MEGLIQSCKRPDLIMGAPIRYRAFIWAADWETPLMPPATGNTLLTVIRVLSQYRDVCVGQLAMESGVERTLRDLPNLSVECYYNGEKDTATKRRR
jgi:hypothetical protein